MKKKFKNSIKILLVSLIVILGLFSVNSITARADKGDDDDDEYESKYSRDYEERDEKNEDDEKEEYYTEEIIEESAPVIIKKEPIITQAEIDQLSDSDNDGISDALDQHPGEDDLIYAVKDVNEDGIVDDFGI